MDLLYELENLAVIAEDNKSHEGPFQELLQEAKPVGFCPDVEAPLQLKPEELKSTYLVKLDGPLGTASKVQELAGMVHLPKVVEGSGDASGDASFCFVNGVQKSAIITALSNNPFSPTFIHVNMAEKALSRDSAAPCLGYDATLPHHRLTELAHDFLPAQNQYPVWYFFYGTLADPEVLVEKLELCARPSLRPATVDGANIRTWGGKYKALVDGDSIVAGWAYKITSAGHEEALRYYETSQYEVVRCVILINDTDERDWGLTFRFVGACD